MKLKKLLAALCACAMVFALAVPAFAASNNATGGSIENGTETKFEGSTLPDDHTKVSVSVLYDLTKLYVNPYGLPYKVTNGTITGDDDVSEIKEGTTTAGWFSNTAAIRNDSEDELLVGVTMKTELQSTTVKVVADTDSVDTSINCLYGELELAQATLSAKKVIEPDWDTGVVKFTVPEAGNDLTPADYTGSFVLKGGTPAKDTVGNDIVKPAFAAFRIRGSAVLAASATGASPGDAGWGQNDLADVTVAFSFKPKTTP